VELSLLMVVDGGVIFDRLSGVHKLLTFDQNR
jgi:hypothetical protein